MSRPASSSRGSWILIDPYICDHEFVWGRANALPCHCDANMVPIEGQCPTLIPCSLGDKRFDETFLPDGVRFRPRLRPGTRPRIDAVVLSYNRPRFLRLALESLRRQEGCELRVTVVDNPSASSPEIEALMAEFPEMTLVKNRENDGFTGGMNLGLSKVSADLVYLTEDDMRLPPDALRRLLDLYLASDDTALVGATVVDEVAPTENFCAGGQCDFDGEPPIWFNIPEVFPQGLPDDPAEVTVLPGNTMLGSLEMFRQFGGFRREFFMYTEDIDLSHRLVLLRGKLRVHRGVRIVHLGGTSGASTRVAYHKIKNTLLLFLMYAPVRVAWNHFARQCVWMTVRSLIVYRKVEWLRLRAVGFAIRHLAEILRERRHWRPRALSRGRRR